MADNKVLKSKLVPVFSGLLAFIAVFVIRILFAKTGVAEDSFKSFYDLMGLTAFGEGCRWELPDSTGVFYSLFLLPLTTILNRVGFSATDIHMGLQIFTALLGSFTTLMAFSVFRRISRGDDIICAFFSISAGVFGFSLDMFSTSVIIPVILWFGIFCLCHAWFAEKGRDQAGFTTLAGISFALLLVVDIKTLFVFPMLLFVLLIRRFVFKRSDINEIILAISFLAAFAVLLFTADSIYTVLGNEFGWRFPSYVFQLRVYLVEVKKGLISLASKEGIGAFFALLATNIWCIGISSFGIAYIVFAEIVRRLIKRSQSESGNKSARFLFCVASTAVLAMTAEAVVISLQNSVHGFSYIYSTDSAHAFFGLQSYGELLAVSVIIGAFGLYKSVKVSKRSVFAALIELVLFTVPVIIFIKSLIEKESFRAAGWFRDQSPFFMMFTRWADGQTVYAHFIIPVLLLIGMIAIYAKSKDFKTCLTVITLACATQFVFVHYIYNYAAKRIEPEFPNQAFARAMFEGSGAKECYVGNPTMAKLLQLSEPMLRVRGGYPSDDASEYLVYSDIKAPDARKNKMLKGSKFIKLTDNEWVYYKGEALENAFVAYPSAGTHFDAYGYVDWLYLNIFGRHADEAAAQGWMDMLENGVSPVKLIQHFMMSEEYNQNNPDNKMINQTLSAVMLNEEFDAEIAVYLHTDMVIGDIISALSRRPEYREILKSLSYYI